MRLVVTSRHWPFLIHRDSTGVIWGRLFLRERECTPVRTEHPPLHPLHPISFARSVQTTETRRACEIARRILQSGSWDVKRCLFFVDGALTSNSTTYSQGDVSHTSECVSLSVSASLWHPDKILLTNVNAVEHKLIHRRGAEGQSQRDASNNTMAINCFVTRH